MGYSSVMPVMTASIDPTNGFGGGDFWHVMVDDGKPLCRAPLSGKLKTTKKGQPTCSECRTYDFPNIYGDDQELLLRIARGDQVYDGPRAHGLGTLIRHGVVLCSQGRPATLTSRGKLVAIDLVRPALWRDGYGVVHARRPLSDTYCWMSTGLQYYVDLVALHEAAKRLKLTKTTCLRCGVA